MKRMIVAASLITAAVAVVAFLGFSAVNKVSAAANNRSLWQNSAVGDRHGGRGFGGGMTDEDLANALGISVDELNTARETAQNALLDQAVADGLITQAQADAIRERGTGFGMGPRGLGGWLSEGGLDFDAFLADALGISEDELQAARQTARDAALDRAVSEGEITQEQADLIRGRQALAADETFQSSMRSAFEAAVNQAVADGVITQAQADQILAQEQAGPRGFGGFGGRHGGGPGFFGAP